MRQRRVIRRLLAIAALVGLAVGLLAQAFISVPGDSRDIEALVRVALLFPAIMFGLWWLLSPELLALDADAAPTEEPVLGAEERLKRIESTFDSAATPRARQRDLSGASLDDRARFRASIGIHESTAGSDLRAFGVPRPDRDVPRDVRRDA
ncbi:MAG: hypothetical protein JWM25_1013 [Thermoleophilia bacterium]|nr:hypothetical protein [Thermoleophilia bacterium]MCZ4496430.1 hypothetical protein [Thermoleophilia bacterium]